MFKKVLATVATVALALAMVAMPTVATATQPDFICPSYAPSGSDKINTSGDPATVEYSAPNGYVIDYYCVKAANDQQIVLVDPPTQTVIIDHPNVGSVSHFSVHWIPATVEPTPVSGDATTAAQTCDDEDYQLVSGSITPVPTTGVVYQLWNADKTVLLIDNFAANSGPLANGTYYVKVLPASDDYTVSEANTWLERVVAAYGGECAPASVSGDATVVGETCDVEDYTLVPGSITPVPTTGVTYQLWNADKTVLLIDNFAANSGPLANGTYFVKVLPASDDYTVSEANTWLERVVGAYGKTCLGEIATLGDPFDTQECVANEDEELPGTWLATLTIIAADHVQYRVYFHNGITWIEQGIWAAGVYEAGPTGDFPYGTKIKVVAEAVGNYILTADPNEWEFEFTQPSRCQLPDFGVVTPLVTFGQTCSAGATYTLGIDGGVAGTVLFSVNGGPTTTTLGTFSVASPSSIEIVATPGPDTGFVNEPDGVPDGVVTFTKEFPALAACGDLTTLALTGSSDTTPAHALTAFLGLLGLAMVRSGVRANRFRQEA